MENHKNLSRAYSDPTWLYDIRGFFILTFAYQDTLWRQIKFFEKNMGTRHAEVAVGSGTLLELTLWWRKFLRRPKIEIFASEKVDSMLASARKRLRKYPHIHIESVDACAMSYPDMSFDTVNIANSIHCIDNVESAFSEMFRILVPGGTLACNVLLYPKDRFILKNIAQRINDWGMRKGILHTPYEWSDLEGIVQRAGFEILNKKRHGNALYLILLRPKV